MRLSLMLLMAVGHLWAAHPDATFHAEFVGASDNVQSIAVSEKGAQVSLPVTDPAVQAQIKGHFQPGDRLTITTVGGTVQQIGPEIVPITPTDRALVLLACLAVHLIFGFILLRSKFKRLVIGDDNRYSNSKCQMALWFGTLAVVYLATTFLRWAASGYSPDFAGGVEIPKNLLLLSGLSVLSFGAAKGITTAKQSAAAAGAAGAPPPGADPAAGAPPAGVDPAAAPPVAGAPPAPAAKTVAASPQFPNDLLCDDKGNPDIGDYQMIAVTAIAVGVYVTQILGFLGTIALLHHVTVPDVDSSILATFGLGQGAYLVKKQLGD